MSVESLRVKLSRRWGGTGGGGVYILAGGSLWRGTDASVSMIQRVCTGPQVGLTCAGSLDRAWVAVPYTLNWLMVQLPLAAAGVG
jgi:hypothetical protein